MLTVINIVTAIGILKTPLAIIFEISKLYKLLRVFYDNYINFFFIFFFPAKLLLGSK